MIAGAILALVFLFLSALHGYWLFRAGPPGTSLALPEVEGKPAFTPGPLSTAGVAVLLLLAAVACAAQAGLAGLPRSALSRTAVWVLVVVFALRAVGDFRLVGFFKRVRGTGFARMDSWVYSPLCVVISGLCGWLLRST